MNFRFQNLLGAPYRGGNAVVSNNTLLISPIGNRISVTDLLKFETLTLPFQSSSNISRIAASPDGVFLIAVDDNGRQFINLRLNGEFIAVGVGKLVEIWRSPGLRTFATCNNKVTCVDWSPDSRYLLAGWKDLTVIEMGFSSGVFGLYQMPDFVCIQLLSVSREKITTGSFNELGNWFLIVLVIKRL
ncbi:putative transcription factor WD40-like family [Helianthus annuus]|nr:putative transcription factor WD40-like family [Helianthus annuus]